MARGDLTRPRSPRPRHDEQRTTEVVRLRPTWRGCCTVVVLLALIGAEVWTGEATLLLVVTIMVVPLAAAPFVALRRAQRARGAEVHMMLVPPLVPVGSPCDLLVHLARPGGAGLPPTNLDRPMDRWSSTAAAPASGSNKSARRRNVLALGLGRLIRWDGLRSDQAASLGVPLPTKRRGVFTIGPLRLWVHDPFGLCGLTVATAKPVTLVVHPPPIARAAQRSAHRGSSGPMQFSAAPTTVHTDDPGGEWSGLRPYQPGDRLHLLSWQAEARLGLLLVHDFRPDAEDVASIVLDDRPGVHRQPAFEKALGVLYGLVHGADGQASEYDVSTFSGKRVRGPTTPDGLVALVTFLAETNPTRSVRRDALGGVPQGAVVITTPTAEPTLPPMSTQGGLVVVE